MKILYLHAMDSADKWIRKDPEFVCFHYEISLGTQSRQAGSMRLVTDAQAACLKAVWPSIHCPCSHVRNDSILPLPWLRDLGRWSPDPFVSQVDVLGLDLSIHSVANFLSETTTIVRYTAVLACKNSAVATIGTTEVIV